VRIFEYTRAPALALGLLWYSWVPLWCAGEGFAVSGNAGTLWVQDEGAAAYWHSGIALDNSALEQQDRLYLNLDFAQVVSDLPGITGTLSAPSAGAGFDTRRAGLHVSGGLLRWSSLSAELGNIPVTNEGGEGFFFGLSAPLYIGSLTLTPSWYYGKNEWRNGDCYWFFGRPDIPALHIRGASVAWREQHSLAFQYLSLDADILDNAPDTGTIDDTSPNGESDAVRLFTSRLDGFAAYYRFSAEKAKRLIPNFDFTGTLGWLSAAATAEGALTASNQHYWLFPYLVYRVSGSLSAHTLFGAIDMRYTHSLLQYHISLGAFQVFMGELAGDTYYKEKSLFGGRESLESLGPLDLGGIGAAFILLDVGMPALTVNRRTKVSWGIKKAFVIPWGYEAVLAAGEETSAAGSSDFKAEWLRTILLSGLSVYFSLSL
jgi:hypothetical protein